MLSRVAGASADDFAADIKRVMSEQSLEFWELSRDKYIKHGGLFTNRKILELGGWGLIRKTYFSNTNPRNEGAIRANQLVSTEVNRLRRIAGDKELIAERVMQIVEKMPPVKIAYRPKPSHRLIDRTLNLLLSDMHYGANLTKAEHLQDYGPKEEAEALWSVVKNVCEYKLEHRKQTELAVCILGDVIENQLHDGGGAAPLHLQVCRAIYLLNQAIGHFASSFPKVRVFFAVGNHGRDTAIHHKRATNQKFNGIETTLYYAVKSSCRGLRNVSFDQPLTPWVDYHAQGHRVYATHGDGNLNPGNPGNTIDTKSLENQTNKINASLKDREEYKIFAVGHVHQAMVTQLPNGAYLITNGAQVPPGGFAQSIGIMEAPTAQVMWETTDEHPVGDFRFIAARPCKDSRIKPFSSLEDY